MVIHSGYVVENLEHDAVTISYFVRSKAGASDKWQVPEAAVVYRTPQDQIIMKDIVVQYSCITIIRCKIDADSIAQINKAFEKYITTNVVKDVYSK